MQDGAHVLDAAAGRAHDAEGPPVGDGGKHQSRAVDVGHAAVRPHTEQALFPGQQLHFPFIAQRHVIGKNAAVQPHIQGLFHFAQGVFAGNGDMA